MVKRMLVSSRKSTSSRGTQKDALQTLLQLLRMSPHDEITKDGSTQVLNQPLYNFGIIENLEKADSSHDNSKRGHYRVVDDIGDRLLLPVW